MNLTSSAQLTENVNEENSNVIKSGEIEKIEKKSTGIKLNLHTE